MNKYSEERKIIEFICVCCEEPTARIKLAKKIRKFMKRPVCMKCELVDCVKQSKYYDEDYK